jgi:hypothetical protein
MDMEITNKDAKDLNWTIGFYAVMEENLVHPETYNPMVRIKYNRVYGSKPVYVARLKLIMEEPCAICTHADREQEDEEKEVFFLQDDDKHWVPYVCHYDCFQSDALQYYAKEHIVGSDYEISYTQGTIQILNK